MWEINIVLNLFKQFGFGIAQTALVVFLLWKIATNHLAHIASDIKDVSKDIKAVALEVKDIKTQTAAHGERIAKLEGKIEL
jgi:hypothetical protein